MGGCGQFTMRLDRAVILMHAFTRSLVHSFARLLICIFTLVCAFACLLVHAFVHSLILVAWSVGRLVRQSPSYFFSVFELFEHTAPAQMP